MHILSPETDNCPSWISGRERMTVENISWSISTKECCRPRRGLNPRPPGLQSDGASKWAIKGCKLRVLILVYMIHQPTIHVCTKFQLYRFHSSREICKENVSLMVNYNLWSFHLWQIVKPITGFNSRSYGSLALIQVYTIHQPTVHVCSRFQLCNTYSSWEKCDKNFSLMSNYKTYQGV